MLCYVDIGDKRNRSQEIHRPDVKIKNNIVVAELVVEKETESVDEINIKQKEMRDTIVLVTTRRGSGSGTIIDRLETDIKQMFKYRVLTNAHITHLRFTEYLRDVDSITGRVKVGIIDTGCEITTFDYHSQDRDNRTAKVVAENTIYDLAILSFVSPKELAVAKIADIEMLEQVRVFDDVFAIGCQLGQAPTPTVGIVSQVLIGIRGNKEWIIYSNTAQISPGSSGGGLFKKYDDHYYLIGIPYRVATINNCQIVPHLSHAISMKTANEFIRHNNGHRTTRAK